MAPNPRAKMSKMPAVTALTLTMAKGIELGSYEALRDGAVVFLR